MAQPSMSKAQQLIQCSWAFNNPAVPRVVANEYMRYGSAFHELVAKSLENGVAPRLSLSVAPDIASRFDVDVEELKAHASPAYEKLIKWLSGDNPWKCKLLPVPKGAIVIEKSVALHVPTGKARFIANPDENHIYQEAGADDHPGTVDLALDLGLYGNRVPVRLRDAVLIIDHKTGLTFDPPRENAQLKSLGVAFRNVWKRKRAVVGLLHAHRESLPEVYVDELSPEELTAHHQRLRPAFARIGDGSMRPGPSCDWCAANAVCPTRGGSLIQLASIVTKPEEPLVHEARVANAQNGNGAVALAPRKNIDLNSPEGMGLAHMLLQWTRKIDDDWSTRIKANIRAGAVAYRPDGKMLELKETERKNLSIASLDRALQRKAIKQPEYDKLKKRLEEIGAIETLKREELRAVDDR